MIKLVNENKTVDTPVYENGICTYSKSIPNAVSFLVSGMDIAEAFFEGRRNYNYETHSCVGGVNGTGDQTCHCFTQMVWKETTHIGCSYALHGNVTYYAACAYHPVGNVKGAYEANVPKVDEPILYPG